MMKLKYSKPAFNTASHLNIKKLSNAVKKYKTSAAWGLDIGGNALKAVKVVQTVSGAVIDEIDVIEYPPLPPDVDFLQTSHIKDALQAFKRRHSITGIDNVLVSIPGQLALARFTTVPPADKKQIKNIVGYEARQQIPLDLKDIVWDYQQFTEHSPDVEGIEIGLFASKRTTLDGILADVNVLGTRPTALQLSSLAVSNFIFFDQQLDGPAIIISLEKEHTDLIIIDSRRLWLRSIPLSVVDADFVREIQKSMEYYKSLRKEVVNFKGFLLIGSKFKEPAAVKFITDAFAYEVKVLASLNKLKLSDKIVPAHFNENLMILSVAIGLAIQGVGLGAVNTNLLPPEYIKAAELSKKKPYAIAALGCIAFSLMIQYGVLKIRVNHLLDSKDFYQKESQKLRGLEQRYKSADALAQKNKSSLDLVSSIDSNRYFWIEMLDKLLSSIPDAISIQSVQSSWVDTDTIEVKGKEMQNQQKNVRKPAKTETEKKVLLIGIKGESREPTIGFIEENILKPIQKIALFDQKVPAFKNVEIVPGSCRQVSYEEEGNRYIGFEIRWIVKSQEEIRTETESLPTVTDTAAQTGKS